MYSLEKGEQIRRFDSEDGPIDSVVSPAIFIHHGTAVMTSGNNGLVQLWDAKNNSFNVLQHRRNSTSLHCSIVRVDYACKFFS